MLLREATGLSAKLTQFTTSSVRGNRTAASRPNGESIVALPLRLLFRFGLFDRLELVSFFEVIDLLAAHSDALALTVAGSQSECGMRAAESCHWLSQMSGHRPFRCKLWVRSQLLLPTEMNGQATVTRLHYRRKSIELVKPQRICRPLAFQCKVHRCLSPVESITWQHLAAHIGCKQASDQPLRWAQTSSTAK